MLPKKNIQKRHFDPPEEPKTPPFSSKRRREIDLDPPQGTTIGLDVGS